MSEYDTFRLALGVKCDVKLEDEPNRSSNWGVRYEKVVELGLSSSFCGFSRGLYMMGNPRGDLLKIYHGHVLSLSYHSCGLLRKWVCSRHLSDSANLFAMEQTNVRI